MRPVRVAVAGSVDDGKSTLLGRLMCDSERVFGDEVEAVRKASVEAAVRPLPDPLPPERSRSSGTLDERSWSGAEDAPRRSPGSGGEGDRERGLNLAFFTDGLITERRDGITLDVAWRHLTLGTRRLLLADVPGHAELVRNMATGASTADAALLLVDAARGLQPQTRRHLTMLGGLGVKRVVVCINKMDAVGFDQAVAVKLSDALRSLATALGVSLEVIPVSALDGDNIVRRSDRMPWYAGPTVAERLEAMEPVLAASSTRAVAQLDGDESGWTSLHLISGTLAPGDVVEAWPEGGACRVVELSPLGAGRVRLARALPRGTLLSRGERPRVGTEAMLTVTWLGPSDCAAQLEVTLLQHGRKTPGRVTELSRVSRETGAVEAASVLTAGEVGRLQVRLERATWFDRWEDSAGTGSCLLIDGAGRTVAGARFT
ncbi:MAG: GTP-binding protein [Archangium sp.]|nr:GTP-binding protein [Archangium sp.]